MSRDRYTLIAASALACLLTLFIGQPAIAHTETPKEAQCARKHFSNDIVGDQLKRRASCEYVVRVYGDQSGRGTANTVSAYDPTARIYSRHFPGCYPDQLGNDDFGDCLQQQERFCGEDATWVQHVRVDRENPDEALEYGSRFCAGHNDGSPEQQTAEVRVSIEDLKSIAPSKMPIHSDNGGRGLRHAHTNFFTPAEQITEVKTIAGVETLMRLTPVEFRWDFGDGTTRVTTTPGASAPKFNTKTETSHIYDETGRYEVTLTIVYIGETSDDGGRTWVLEPDTIQIESDPLQADIFRTVTRNVADDCVENPSAWGCGAPGEDSDPAG